MSGGGLPECGEPPALFVGESEMIARIRAIEWSATPVGPMQGWPQSLCTAVSIMLESRHPMLIWWGPEFNLEVVHRNGLRLAKLVNNLLDFARLQSGRLEAAYEPVDLAAFTSELASVFRAAIERAGVGYELDCPSLEEVVYLDRGMWEKIVLNLLSNALKFTVDGCITVSLRAEDNSAVLRVTGTGAGVAVAELPRLFERFYRGDHAKARFTEGSGIGLALVRELTLSHAPEELHLQIRDHGCWRTSPAPGSRGRGITMMKQLTDAVTVDSDDHGTTVRLRKRLPR